MPAVHAGYDKDNAACNGLADPLTLPRQHAYNPGHIGVLVAYTKDTAACNGLAELLLMPCILLHHLYFHRPPLRDEARLRLRQCFSMYVCK